MNLNTPAFGVFNFDSLRHLVLMHAIATAVDNGKT